MQLVDFARAPARRHILCFLAVCVVPLGVWLGFSLKAIPKSILGSSADTESSKSASPTPSDPMEVANLDPNSRAAIRRGEKDHKIHQVSGAQPGKEAHLEPDHGGDADPEESVTKLNLLEEEENDLELEKGPCKFSKPDQLKQIPGGHYCSAIQSDDEQCESYKNSNPNSATPWRPCCKTRSRAELDNMEGTPCDDSD